MLCKFISISGGFLIILLFLSSCGEKHQLIGTWEEKRKFSFWEIGIAYLKGVHLEWAELKLDIYPDSTYKKYGFCGGKVETGKWSVKEDSLILTFDTAGPGNTFNKKRILPIGSPKMKNKRAYLIGRNTLTVYYDGYYKNKVKDASVLIFVRHPSCEIFKPID